MGAITTGIGLISGINTAQLIDSLIALESRGKITLQQRIATLQGQRTALLDINARLLNLKNSAKSLRLDKVFQSALATSSDDTILTATAAANAQPGTFQFIVKQLVATSQKMTKGYVDRTTTPMGLSSLSFEFGRGNLAVDRDLESLNAGAGVDRGRITITDRGGGQATIDLTDVTTLNEVLERINNAAAVKVTASVDGDRLVITDTSGGAGTLTIANAEGDTTATDLGIEGSGVGNVLTGTIINTIGGNTALAALNDGNGVLTRNNVADFTITARDSTQLSIDLGRINLPISNSTLLADLNNGTGVAINSHETDPDFKITDRNGDTHNVKLDGVTTAGGLIQRVALATGGNVTLSVDSTGKKFVITDSTGGTGLLKVTGAGPNADETANDLGILNVAGVNADTIEGSIIPNTITDPPASTLNEVIDRINSHSSNGGKIVASIAADGVSLLINDTTGGSNNLIIRRTVANPYAAAALGIETDTTGVAVSSIDGTRLVAALGSVLTKNLNGGTGLGSATSITIKDRAGTQVTVNSLDTYDSLSQLVKAINDQASAAGVLINVSMNSAGNGLQVTDTSGGAENLVISGDAAAALGLEANVAASSKRGSNLQHRYVSESTLLKDMNYGKGVGVGKFRITDALGLAAVVDIDSDSTTLQDIIEEINSRPIAVRARINDTGDGLIIESDLEVGQSPVTKIKIETVSGTTAKDLNILGTSSTIENAQINGSYERTIALAESDSLDKVMKKINEAGIPVNASVINSGSGATPFRMNFTSAISGRFGELIIDSGDVDLGLTVLAKGQDAKVFFGSDNPENGFLLTSSTNSITGAMDGVTVNLHSVSDTAVSLTVTRDIEKISGAVKQMITNFNDAIGRINQYDFFDVESEQRGPLLGNSTTSQVRDALYRIANGRAQGVTTQYQYLRDVGIKINSAGELVFDQAAFETAYQNDPQAVENLFAAFKSEAAPAEEIFPGAFVQSTTLNVTSRGIGELFDALLDRLTNSIDGVVTLADKSFQDQIKAANERVAVFDERLEAKRRRLQSQFTAMEAALAKLQGQSSALASLANNVLIAQNKQ